MKRRHLAIVLVAMAALSGCAMLDGGDTSSEDETEFDQDVTFPWAGVSGDSVTVEVTVENTGDNEGEHEATLSVDGETVTSESTTLAAGSTETLALTHNFEEAGEYTLSVGDSETTITVHESPEDLIVNTNFERGTRVSEEKTTAEGVAVRNGTEFDVRINETATVRTNYEEQTQYTKTNGTTEVFIFTTNETEEEWIVGGTAYRKTVAEDEETPEYESEQSDEFEDDEISDPTVLQYLEVTQTDGDYFLRFDPQGSEGASDLWGAFGDDNEISPDSVTDLTMEYRIDGDLYRPAGITFEVTIQNDTAFKTLDMTLEQEVVSYGEPVEVEVPEEVRENAER